MSPGRRVQRGAAAIVTLVTLLFGAATLALIFAALQMGDPLDVVGATSINLVLGVSFTILGYVVVTRGSGGPLGWIYLATGIQTVQAFSGIAAYYGLSLVPGSIPLAHVWWWVLQWSWAPGFTMLVTFSLLLFPDGRLLSRRWRVVGWLSGLMLFLLIVPTAVVTWPLRDTGITDSPDVLLSDIGAFMIPILALASLASVMVRFRRSAGIERQQLKWFTAAVPVVIGFVLLVGGGDPPPPPLIYLLGTIFIIPLLPIAIGIAMFRYRLFEIDRLISRTLSYVLVTGILVAVYGGTVLLLSTLTASFVPKDAPAFVALATLVAYALFQPVMRRVRRAVDRRFDRARYDGERTVAAFSERLRDEVEMTTITTDLTTTTKAALAPTRMSIWIRVP